MQFTVAEAIALQEELRRLVDATDHASGAPRYVAGLDVAYDGDEYAAAVVVLEVIRAAGVVQPTTAAGSAQPEETHRPAGGVQWAGAAQEGDRTAASAAAQLQEGDRAAGGAQRAAAVQPEEADRAVGGVQPTTASGSAQPEEGDRTAASAAAQVQGGDRAAGGAQRAGAVQPEGADRAVGGARWAAGSAGSAGVQVREVERAVVRGRTSFPYVPGLFAFREVPGVVAALERLRVTPELLVCDGQGLAHPRRFGLACHLGVVTGLPSIGVGKTVFVGAWEEPGAARGAVSDLVLDGEVVGKVLRTQNNVKPVFVSVGHRVSLGTAVERVLELAPRYRLPETTRAADRACRDGLKGLG